MLRQRSIFVVLVSVVLCAIVWQSGRTQSPLRRITNTTPDHISINPTLSGDGRIVAFESTADIAGAGGSDGFRAIRANVAVDSVSFLQISDTRAPAPATSQDGSRIAFASKENPLGSNSDGNSEIFLYDGARLIQITNTLPGDSSNRVTNGNFQPSISDDGRFIAFSSNRQLAGQNSDGNFEIYVYDALAQSFAQLTNSAVVVGSTDAKISGDGNHVAYIFDGGAEPGASRDLLLANRNGSSPARVLVSGASSLAMTYGRAISDDGARVVWSAQTATNSTQVFLYDGRNNLTRQITSLGARATDVSLQATISGDGSRLAFATRRPFLGNTDGSVDLYSFDIPTGTFGRITSGPADATSEVVSSLSDDGCVTLEKTKLCKYDYSVDGENVEAISFRPDSDGKFPGVLLIPGYQRRATDYIFLGRILADHGFASLAVTQRGFGTSTGKPDYVGPNTLKSLTAGFDRFRREPFVDGDKMGIFGYSRGGMAASLLAVKLKHLKAAVFGAGIYDFKKEYDEVKIEGIRENMKAETGLTDAAIKERSSVFQMKDLHCPVLILHGEKDENVPVSQALLLRDRLMELKKEFTLKLFPNAPHGIPTNEWLPVVLDFFSHHLKGVKEKETPRSGGN